MAHVQNPIPLTPSSVFGIALVSLYVLKKLADRVSSE